MTNDHEESLVERRPIEVSMQPPPGRATTPVRAQLVANTRQSGGAGTVLASGALAFLLGGAGAWTYLNYLDPVIGGKRLAVQQAKGEEPGINPAMTGLVSRVDEISTKLDRLQLDVDHVSKNATPPDLAPIDKRLSLLEGLPRKVEAMDARVSALPAKIDQEGRKITTLMADMEGVRNQVISLRSELPMKGISETAARSERPGTETTSEPPREIAPPVALSLDRGIELFKQGKYDQASESFASLTRSHPDDARSWYYAALARGLATRDWKGETEKLVTEGVNRESAGKPEKSQIDSAFSDLTSTTGKEWLAFYRRRVH
jgi:hypothetical protein